ncbi:histidinol-phosphate transaminase [Paenibacillus agricola]|uniref:Histidinol-phosphate aminotransferase n=1 Tax=Paenibacillus agricola TaxID=2716264 RepID=A0ABX0J5L1_9BACL|nr:histidinol-phosphate transaminase [Paenibacillus agricola]NHN29334.1 histidinol-phosphate transaminase [Paenibacillus agricola]
MTDHTQIEPRRALQSIKPYTPGKPIWEVQRELGLVKVVKLASNENPLGASPLGVKAAQDYLAEIHRYPDANALDVKQAIARKLDLQLQQLIVTNGGDELISLISEAFLEPEDEIIVPSPSFTEYIFGARLMDAGVVDVPLNQDFAYDIEAILSAVTEKTKIVYICTPNNPTGTYLPKQDMERLLSALPARVLIVVDAAYSHFATAADYTDGLEYVRAGYPVVVLQTFSKIYGLAGLRIGFGAAPEAIIRHIVKVKEPFNVNALAQAAAAAAITDDQHVQSSSQLNTAGRERLYNALSLMGFSFTESMANFVLVELGAQAKTYYEQLLAQGVVVRYGDIWGLPQHVRITIGTTEENEFLIQALQSLLPK